MTPDSNDNGRVTLAVLGERIAHLTEEVRSYRTETRDELAACRSQFKEQQGDHEGRLRALEAAGRRSNWQDVGAYLTAIAAGVAGWLGGGR